MSDLFSERLRLARERLGESVTGIAKESGVNRGTWQRYESGTNRPDADTLAVLHRRGIDINWLLTGEGTMLRGDAPPLSGTVPVVGLAECGLRGWYQESPTGLYASAPPAVAADPRGLAVVAIGDSMRSAGIKPGDLVFCQSADALNPSELVLVELVDGTMSLKQLSGMTSSWVTLQGWLEADDDGVQMPYQDERRRDQVKALLRVALVQPGLAQQVTPGSAAGAGYCQDDRLYEIAIRTTLHWYETADVGAPSPDVLAAMICRSARQLRARQGDQLKTDAELVGEVRYSLDIARDMLTAWKPK
ncbi:MAG: helix-turn-helix domain-containing protein [Rhodospirillaceae bacterium]|nr:helix-turn-helix domain-containing protein [Rhodospirillales bacterium]